MLSVPRPSIGIYRHGFLPLSETFIADHLLHLRRYDPIVLADHLVGGIRLAGNDVHLLHDADTGRLARLRARLAGRYPAFEKSLAGAPPTLIHAHFLQDGAKMLPFAWRRKIPLIVTAHGYDATAHRREHARRTDGLWYLALKPLLAAHATAILCVSNWIRDCLLDSGYPARKLVVMPLGIDLDALPPVPDADQRRGVVAAGRLVEKKGMRFLIDAWSRLPAALRDEPLTIIGDGPLRADLEAQARRLGVKARFTGALPRAQLLEQMASHRILAMPSIRAATGDAEGLPIVLMEAQALELAVVAFDEGPMAEAILPGRTGLLAQARMSGDLADKLATLLADPARGRAMGLAGKAHARARFDIRTRMTALEDFYDTVLEAARKTA